MNILMLAPHPFYIDRGTPIDVDLLLRALSQRGDEVDLVTYHLGEDRSYPGVRIHRIPAPWGIRRVPPGLSLMKLVCDLLLLLVAWRLVRSNDYDLVHAGEESVFIALLFKKLYRLPYIYDMDSSIAQQSVEQLPALRPLAPLLERAESRAIRHSLAAAPVCNALADLARARGATFVETLHDISQLTARDMRPEANLRTRLGLSESIIMYVGNLAPYQGVDLLLEAAAEAARKTRKFGLVIAGGTEEAIASYTAKAARLEVADLVHFIGRWPVTRLGSLLAEANILVVPRIRGINTPMKLFPFLHSGKPVVVTDLPTHTQLLDDSVALLAPPDAVGFGEALAMLLEDDELQRRLGRAGRAFVERGHTWPAYFQRVDRLYTHVAAQVGSAPSHSLV